MKDTQMKLTPEDWRWLADLLDNQDASYERPRLFRLSAGCREKAEELELAADAARKPLAFIERPDGLWILGHSPKPFAAPTNAQKGFWILAFALEHPGEDIDVRAFADPGTGSTGGTIAVHLSHARQIIGEYRPELQEVVRAVKFSRDTLMARYAPSPAANFIFSQR